MVDPSPQRPPAPRVDAHVHVWRATDAEAPHARTSVSARSDIPIELLREYLDEYGIDRAVLVQPLYPGEDNSYVAQCAIADRERLAAVCVVDPRTPKADERLKHWVQDWGCRGLRLRPRVPEESACFGDPSTYPLWRAAQDLGVVVNVYTGTDHLHTLAGLAEMFPTVSILVDHLALPGSVVGESCSSAPLLRLARYRNVSVKLSGYNYFSRMRFPYGDCHNLLRDVCDAFGSHRLLWGSDFPHVLLHCGYARSVRYLRDCCEWLSDRDLEAIMGGNAVRLYWSRDTDK